MKIQMVDVKRQYEKYKTEFDAAVSQVLASGAYINGPAVKQFSKNMESYLGVKHAIPCASGTDALQLALMALNVGPGDEVITTPFTFIATAEVIELLGATTVFVDIDPHTYNMDMSQVEAKITANTKAIIPVHLYGQPVDMDPLLEIARKHNIPVVEDAAQAVGSEYKGQKVCSLGTMGCISFFPSKNLGAAGDGGMVTTNDDALAEKLRVLANHGSKIRYYHDAVGLNSRLDSLQAAILDVKLRYLDEWNEHRRQNAALYTQLLGELGIQGPVIKNDRTHIFHQYTIQVEKRDALSAFLQEKGIPHGVYYPVPLHQQAPFVDKYGNMDGQCPVSESVAKNVISLPMHPDLTREEITYIVDHIRRFYQQ